jgi:hypothetical protein
MPPDARLADRLLRRIRKRNGELSLEMAIELGMGVLFTFLTAGILYGVLWFICLRFGAWQWGYTICRWGTVLFLVIGAISAWRHVNPFAVQKPMSGKDYLMFAVSGAVTHVPMNRHSIAGFAALIMGGPENLVCALRTWLHRLPTDPALLDQAAEILSQCRPDVDVKKANADPDAVVLLRRLGLIVPRGETLVTLTEKGHSLVGRTVPA